MNSVVERALSDNCCKFCESSVCNDKTKRSELAQRLLHHSIRQTLYVRCRNDNNFSGHYRIVEQLLIDATGRDARGQKCREAWRAHVL